ncbi:phage head closure protein [Desulfosporosinus fructosivorans]
MSDPITLEQLHHKINIQQQSATQDSYGQLVNTWTDFAANIWSFVDPTGGSEFYAAQKVNAEATANIWLRYNAGLGAKPSMKVVFGTRIFDILNVMNWQERNKWIRLVCKEVV